MMVETYYDQIASSYNQLHGEEQRRKLKHISDFISEEKDDYLLDVGCGTGLAQDFFDCNYYGIDPSFELLKKANGNVVQAKAERIPFENSIFDIVLCVSAIHNFQNSNKAIREMKRVGKDNFVITVLKKGINEEKVERLIELLNEEFIVDEKVEDKHDYIFFCKT